MSVTVARTLYVARHGEAAPDGGGLSSAGRRQARLLGRRLRDVPLSAIHHGPLPRARETAALVAESRTEGPRTEGSRTEGPRTPTPLRESAEAGDYVPYLPDASELPADAAPRLLAWLGDTSEQERVEGAELARTALDRFTGTVEDGTPRHELLVTHAFLVGWLVRDALGAAPWRWMGLAPGNSALTVIRYAPGRLPAVLVHNDTRHLTDDLRWTGHSEELHV